MIGALDRARAPVEDLFSLGARLSPDAALGLGWHLAAALAELHDRGQAHHALHPSFVGLDAEGRLVILPAVGVEIAPDPDPSAGSQATDCWQLAPCLDALLLTVDEPSLGLVLSGLRRAKGRLRLAPGRAVRQALAAVLARRPAAEAALVAELGPEWRIEPRPSAWFPLDAFERAYAPGPWPFATPRARPVVDAGPPPPRPAPEARPLPPRLSAPLEAPPLPPRLSPPPPELPPRLVSPDPPRLAPPEPVPLPPRLAPEGPFLRVATLRTRLPEAAPELFPAAELIEAEPELEPELPVAGLDFAEPELELAPVEQGTIRFHPEDLPTGPDQEERIPDDPTTAEEPVLDEESELDEGLLLDEPSVPVGAPPEEEPPTEEPAESHSEYGSGVEIMSELLAEPEPEEPEEPEPEPVPGEPEPVPEEPEPVEPEPVEPEPEPVPEEPELVALSDEEATVARVEDLRDLPLPAPPPAAPPPPAPAPPLAPAPPPPLPEPDLLDPERRAEAPRWGEARGVSSGARRDAELGAGKWSEHARPLAEVARALPGEGARPLELEPEPRPLLPILAAVLIVGALVGLLVWAL